METVLSGTASSPFVGALDALTAQGAAYLFGGSVRRLLAAWSGNSMRLQGNGIGVPIAAIPFTPAGDLDLSAAAAAAAAGGGTAAAGETLYDQTGRLDATQTVIINQMEFGIANQTKGEFGGASAVARWLDLNLGTITQPTFFSIVANVGGLVSSKMLLGTSASNSNRFLRMSAAAPQQNFGTTQAGSNISTGKRLFGFLSNAGSSKIYVDGTLNVTGDAGNTALDMSGGRIGSALSGTTNWNSTAGNTISEVIIFAGDPTGLAGWPAFVTAQKAYFGIA